MAESFTPEEMNTIAEAPMLTGLAVALVDMGLVSTAVEAAAMSKEIAGAAEKYPNNSVIQTVFSKEAIKQGTVKLEKPEIKPEDVKSGAVTDQAIASIQAALTTLDGKATADEIRQYKEFIYACANAVANAAGSGLFGSGAKVSEQEAAALVRIKSALALEEAV